MEHEQELDPIETYAKKLGELEGKIVRHWSFEAEHVGIGQARRQASWTEYKHFEFVVDGSVDCEYDNCDCGCRDCQYHDCNCDNCEDQNDSPDHCSDSDCTANEFAPNSPLRFAWNPEMTEFLERCSEVADRYGFENYARLGGHVHIEAKDLTRRQAVNAVVIAEHVFKIAPEWFTGERDDYNNPNDRAQLEEWVQGSGNPRRDTWASLNNLSWSTVEPYAVGDEWSGRKTTLELRRFRTNFDSRLIQIRGAFGRAVVAYAKSNAQIYWLTRSTDFDAVLAELGFGKH